MPSIFGEDAVLRILDKQALADEMKGLRLDALGFDDARWSSVCAASPSEPYGMLLVTGPTGSGKTTTLYAAIIRDQHTATTRSSPSRTRSSTSCPACCRSR